MSNRGIEWMSGDDWIGMLFFWALLIFVLFAGSGCRTSDAVAEYALMELDEFNDERRKQYSLFNDNSPQPNGIECPVCSSELFDTNPNQGLTSNPPQMDVHCEACDYRGYRVL